MNEEDKLKLEAPVQVNFDPEQKRRLIDRAKKLGLPLATYIRARVLEALEREEKL